MQKLVFFLILALVLISSCGDSDSDNPLSEVAISFDSSSSTTSESSNILFVPLKLEGISNREVFVTYEVSGSADFPLDVTPLTSTTFLIPAGATAFNMEFLVNEDGLVELEPEALEIRLISVSEGGRLGSAVTHTINIEPDDIAIVSFDMAESSTPRGFDTAISFSLSQPVSEDVTVRLTHENIEDSGGDDLLDVTRDVIIPEGELHGVAFVIFSSAYSEDFTGSIEIEIESVFGDAVLNPDQSKIIHTLTITDPDIPSGAMTFDINWTSTGSDTDLDFYMLESGDDVVLFRSETDANDDIETISVPSDFRDGDYLLLMQHFSGDSQDISVTLTVSPSGTLLWEGSSTQLSDTQNLLKDDIGARFALAFRKNGKEFTYIDIGSHF